MNKLRRPPVSLDLAYSLGDSSYKLVACGFEEVSVVKRYELRKGVVLVRATWPILFDSLIESFHVSCGNEDELCG